MGRLPNFFLVGAVKAGTTAFHSLLNNHPDVYMAPIKEPNFFAQSDMRSSLYSPQYRRSTSVNLARYLKKGMTRTIHIADVVDWDQYCSLFQNVGHERAIGEGSNSYLFCPSAPLAISKKAPNAKIIAILRNPVDRAWSHYLMNRKLGYAVAPDFLAEFKADIDKRPRGWGITSNYYELGRYAEQLERFFALFPRRQIKVILYDDFHRDPHNSLRQTFEFLGVDPSHSIPAHLRPNSAALPRWPLLHRLVINSTLSFKLKHRLPDPIKNVAERLLLSESRIPRLQASQKDALLTFYESDIKRLALMLNRDLDNWLK